MPSRRYQDPLAIAVAMALLPTALLPPPLMRCCFRRRATPERREAIPTHPLFSCSVPNRNPRNQEQSYQILVDLIKTSAVKTSREKHLLVGKRVPTHACRQDARTCFNKKKPSFLFQFLITRTPFSLPKNCTPFFLFEIGLIHRIQILRRRDLME